MIRGLGDIASYHDRLTALNITTFDVRRNRRCLNETCKILKATRVESIIEY